METIEGANIYQETANSAAPLLGGIEQAVRMAQARSRRDLDRSSNKNNGDPQVEIDGQLLRKYLERYPEAWIE